MSEVKVVERDLIVHGLRGLELQKGTRQLTTILLAGVEYYTPQPLNA